MSSDMSARRTKNDPSKLILHYVPDDPLAENEPEASGELDSIGAHIPDSVGSIPTPATAPAPQTLRVVKLAPNSNFVLCALDGVTVPVRVSRGMGTKLMKKDIRVERQDDGTYHHLP